MPNVIEERIHDIRYAVQNTLRRRPVNEKNADDYCVMAFELETQAKNLRRRAAEARSFDPA